MAPLLDDPRLRQTWNNISQNAETATESAAAGIWKFAHNYINPCFTSLSSSIEHCTGQCFPDREERARRARERGRIRGRAEYSFDFYDDWDEDEGAGNGGLLGWGNDELDRLLAGSGAYGSGNEQPKKKGGMNYGTRKGGPRRKKTIDGISGDPTIIPSSSSIGFLQSLPFKLGGTLRYKPSAADLQDHPGAHRAELGEEAEPLMDDDDHSDSVEGEITAFGHTRKRSSTTGSGDTSDSFRSRGDLFPSDGEDDAVPLSDEFAMGLERRNTNISIDDQSSGKTRGHKGKRRASSRIMSRTASRTTQSSGQSGLSAANNGSSVSLSSPRGNKSPADLVKTLSLQDLENEEARLRKEEGHEIERKRQAAAQLALDRGLTSHEPVSETKHEGPIAEEDFEEEFILPKPATPEMSIDEGPETASIFMVGAETPLEEDPQSASIFLVEDETRPPSPDLQEPATSESETSFVAARIPNF